MNIPAHIDLRVGEWYELILPGRGSAGYTWTYTMAGNERIVSISRGMAGRPATLQTGKAPPAGSSLDERFVIEAREPGNVSVHFSQQRSWETNKPLHEFTFEIHVDS